MVKIKSYRNRVLDGQIEAQENKLEMLKLKEEHSELNESDLVYKEEVEKYLVALKAEKEKRK